MSKRLTELTLQETLADADIIPFVDKSDTAQSPEGSTRKSSLLGLFNWLQTKFGTAATKDTGTAPTDVTTGNDLNTSEGWPTHIWIPDKLRAEVEAATGGHVTVLYDDKGFPSYMRVIPKFRYEDLGYDAELGSGVATAFLVDGQEKSEILVGQYQATTHDGRAVSLPGKDPRTGINFDDARAACVDKGPGWHLASRHEWVALALWCVANDFEPRGNTSWGRAHDATHETAVRPDGYAPGDSSGGSGRTATGGGPASWRHDGGMTGIADLVGNVWEWCDGLKLVDGRIHCTEDNHYTQDEGDWSALGHYVSNESGTPTLMNAAGVSNDSNISTDWGSLAKEAGYSESQLLQRLLFSPAGIIPQGRFNCRTEEERFPICGGNRNVGSAAGLAALNLYYSRSSARSSIGFRPAFVA